MYKAQNLTYAQDSLKGEIQSFTDMAATNDHFCIKVYVGLLHVLDPICTLSSTFFSSIGESH